MAVVQLAHELGGVRDDHCARPVCLARLSVSPLVPEPRHKLHRQAFGGGPKHKKEAADRGGPLPHLYNRRSGARRSPFTVDGDV